MQKRDSFIGVFDSGIGGLSVLQVCKAVLPNEKFIYYADTPHAPYGNKSNDYIKQRVFAISEMFIKNGAKAIVVACNTATNVGIKMLRERYKIPFVGLEPAIKPASATEGRVLLLCTNATANQEKFKELVKKYGNSNLVILPQNNLAAIIEKNYPNVETVKQEIKNILAPQKRVKAIILGCTHYVLVEHCFKEIFSEIAGSDIIIFNGNLGAANRLKSLLMFSP